MTSTTGSPSADDYVWLQRVTSWPLATAMAAGLVATAVRSGRPAGKTALAATALLVGGTALSTLRVVADSTGLTVGLGPWGWPGYRIPAARIRSARLEKTSPLAYGGWGLRWRPGRVRVIVGRAPGLVVDLTDGTSFGITVRNADQAVRLLNSLSRG